MGAALRDPTVQGKLKALQEKAAALEKQLSDLRVDALIDAAGLVDPTPVSDVIGFARGAARGDWASAALSLVSMVPYAGDVLAKPIKGAKLTKKAIALRKQLADVAARSRQLVADALKQDAAKVAAKRVINKQKRIDKANTLPCGKPIGGNRFGTQSPKKGWSGERADSNWRPEKAGLPKRKLNAIESVTGGKPIKFKDGFPDFSPYVAKVKDAAGKEVRAAVEIAVSKTGDRAADFRRACEAMARKLGVERFDERTLPGGPWVWHHKEDGVTMELLKTKLHKNVPHSGGVSAAADRMY
jgi:hypothetical protein